MRVAGALLCAIVVTVAPATAGASDDSARVRQAVSRLVGDSRKLPRKAASATTKARLVRTATAVRRASSRKPCTSLRLLQAYTRAPCGGRAQGPAAAPERERPGPPP